MYATEENAKQVYLMVVFGAMEISEFDEVSEGPFTLHADFTWNLAWNVLIGLGIAALAAGLLEWRIRRRGSGVASTDGEHSEGCSPLKDPSQ